MRRMKITVLMALAGMTLQGNAQQVVKGGFVAMLGQDTLYVESYQRSDAAIEGTIVQKFPRTTVVRYTV